MFNIYQVRRPVLKKKKKKMNQHWDYLTGNW